VRRQPGPEYAYENKNFQPKFVGEPLSVGFWAAISYGHQTLILLRKRTENDKRAKMTSWALISINIFMRFQFLTFCHSIKSVVDLKKVLDY
jgi:hypothetical protein